MKKTTTLFFVFTLFSLFLHSCDKEKDGIFQPKKKISQIVTKDYTKNGNLIREEEENWQWDKKRLNSISYSDGSILSFQYDGNRLQSMNLTAVEGESYTCALTYNQKELKKMIFNYSASGEIQISVRAREDGKITELEYEYTQMDKKGAFGKSVLRMIAPLCAFPLNTSIAQMMQLCEENGDAVKGSLKWRTQLFYYENNVSQVHTKSVDLPVYSDIFEQFKYDKAKNPYYNSLINNAERNGYDFVLSFSENNITYSSISGAFMSMEWEYTYKDGWPVQKVRQEESTRREVYYYYVSD